MTRAEFGGDSVEGPCLFGGFTIADAMVAPVVWRFHSYNVPLSPAAQVYCDAMRAHPAMSEWKASALAETDVLAHYDQMAQETYGGPRG